MSAIHLLVMIEVQPGKRHQQIAAYEALKPLVLAEKGCLQYDLLADQADEHRFVLVEKWEDLSALQAHESSGHMLAADEANSAFRARPATVIRLSAA